MTGSEKDTNKAQLHNQGKKIGSIIVWSLPYNIRQVLDFVLYINLYINIIKHGCIKNA